MQRYWPAAQSTVEQVDTLALGRLPMTPWRHWLVQEVVEAKEVPEQEPGEEPAVHLYWSTVQLEPGSHACTEHMLVQ